MTVRIFTWHQLCIGFISLALSFPLLYAQAQRILDIRSLDPSRDALIRVYGSVGRGNLGLPVAGPGDVDGDGYPDLESPSCGPVRWAEAARAK